MRRGELPNVMKSVEYLILGEFIFLVKLKLLFAVKNGYNIAPAVLNMRGSCSLAIAIRKLLSILSS